MEKILAVADAPGATPEQKLKALDLLKQYEDYGTTRFDDEREAEQSRLQWERVFEKVEALKETEHRLLKSVAVRNHLAETIRCYSV